MEIETLLIGLGSAVATLVLTILFQRHVNGRNKAEVGQRDEQIRTLEKEAHQKERSFLEERNRMELENLEAIKQAKAIAFEEGRQRGIIEGDAKRLTDVMALQAEFADKLQAEREKAGSEARERLRAEYELQSKLFSVQISPLVRITESKGLFRSDYQSDVGYQYQLLINGIPAFQPHVIIERSENRKEVNEENVREFLNSAKQIAEGAIEMYLGANGQFAKLALPVVKRLKG
ncbi:MAG: hypothetical protein EG825_01870 [Rhodocyclaceae bacterium]|nr:hypothetical protein [Rhodocyclaceae bacterium]